MFIKHKEPVSGTIDARLLTDLHRHTDRNTNRQIDMTNYMTVDHVALVRLVIIVNKLDNNSLCALSIIPSSTKKEFIPDSGRLISSVGSKSALKQSHPWFKS